MTNPRGPIYWHQGLFLQPEHFQQATMYSESLLTPLKSYLTPYFWGVCEQTLDTGALREYKVNLTQGEFLFRDGTWISINHNAVLQPRSFKELWERVHEPFVVYIALKCLNVNGEQIDKEENKSSKARFALSCNNAEVADLYNRGHSAQVPNLNYVLHLVWDKEVELYPDYELIPIARIEYNGQIAIFSHDFIPPHVSVSGSPLLLSYLKNMKETLYSHSLNLSGYKNLSQILSGDYKSSSLFFLMILKTINHFVSLLNHYVEMPNLSPFVLYGVLRQLLGELSVSSDKIDALGRTSSGELLVPAYNHVNLGHCFKQVYILINEILDGLLDNMECVVPLIQTGNYFSADIPVDLLSSSNGFYLCIKTDLPLDELVRSMTHTIKIGSKEDIPILIKRALSGVPLKHLSELPFRLAWKPNVNYFTLNHEHLSWLSIKEFANLCVFWSNLQDKVEMNLYVLKGKVLMK